MANAKFNREIISQVTESLFIGSYEAATDSVMLKFLLIDSIISLDIQEPILDRTFQHKFINISDESSSNILKVLPEAMDFLDGEGRCLVQCRHGVSRSAAIVIAYLMRKDNIDYFKAFEILRLMRPECQPNDGFVSQLILFRFAFFKKEVGKVHLKN